MALKNSITYFRPLLDALGYHEHDEAFNFENIPSHTINKAYHLTSETSTGLGIPQGEHREDAGVIVRVFKKLYLDTNAGRDAALVERDLILQSVLDIKNFASGGIINAVHNSTDVLPLGDTNDNVLMLEMSFNIRVALGINQ